MICIGIVLLNIKTEGFFSDHLILCPYLQKHFFKSVFF